MIRSMARATRRRPLPAAALLRYLAAAALARLADEGSRVALLLLAIGQPGGATYGGLLVGALMVPHAVAAPLVGAAADRTRRLRALYACDLFVFGAAIFGSALFIAVPWLAFTLAAVAGCAAPLIQGGLTSLIAEIVADDLARQRAFALDSASYGVAGLAGPAIAAVVAAAFGAVWAVAGIAVAGTVTGLLIGSLPIPNRLAGALRSVRPPLTRAAGAVWQRPALAAVTTATTVSQFGMGMLPPIAALLALQAHAPGLTGASLSVMAAGGLVGSLLYARWPIRRLRPETVVALALLAVAIPFVVMTFVTAMWPLLVLFSVSGLLNGPLFTALLTVRDREAPDEVRTQIFTLGAGLKTTAGAAGSGVAGVAAGLGTGPLLLLVAGAQIVAAASGATLLRRRRKVR